MASRSVPMNAEFTCLVITCSPSAGATKSWNAKPGEEGCRGEVGDVEEWAMWIILCCGEMLLLLLVVDEDADEEVERSDR